MSISAFFPTCVISSVQVKGQHESQPREGERLSSKETGGKVRDVSFVGLPLRQRGKVIDRRVNPASDLLFCSASCDGVLERPCWSPGGARQ